jgi:diguanylate cyclase (GGDEF)-like protein/PAS domain S-box-containing protein
MRDPHPGFKTPPRRKRGDPGVYGLLDANIVDYVWRIDRRGIIKGAIANQKNVLGYSSDELTGKHLEELIGPATQAVAREHIARRLAEQSSFTSDEIAINGKDGQELWFELACVPWTNSLGNFRGHWAVVRDITARKRAEGTLLYHERLLNGIARAAAELVGAPTEDVAIARALEIVGLALNADRLLVVESLDPAALGRKLQLTHIWQADDVEKVDGRTFVNMSAALDLAVWADDMAKGRPIVLCGDTTVAREAAVLELLKSKSSIVIPMRTLGPVWAALQVDDCGGPRKWSAYEIGALTTFAEMVGGSIMRWQHRAEQRRAELELRRSGSRDALTGLANRRGFIQALGKAKFRDGGQSALHYLDLDHFKDVNDALGHPIGDALLQQVARRLQRLIRHTDLLARFGGDEFVILEADVEDPGQAGVLAKKIIAAMSRPFHIDGHEVLVAASIGVALGEPGRIDPEALLAHAELALYRAKAEGRQTFRLYTEDMDREARSRVTLGDELRRAIAEKQFFMVYQPQVHLDGNRIVGVEALIRWRHPRRGIVLPSDFIGAAEHNGMILAIGAWCLREVCRQARMWIDAGIVPPVIGVNVSAVQVRRPDELEQLVFSILEETRLPRGLLQLELTETTLMEASQAQSDVLARLNDEGVKISLDDFGTGYSSLDYLRRYPVDQIKIAQVFVNGMERNQGDAAIVRATIGLARELGLRVIAEGPETGEQVRMLDAWGCKEIQGWYFSKALTPDAIEPLLRIGKMDPSAPSVGEEGSRTPVS